MERGREEPGGFVAEVAMMDAALRSQREMARLWMALNAIGRSERPATEDGAPPPRGAPEASAALSPDQRW
jgi:hypothetical protein